MTAMRAPSAMILAAGRGTRLAPLTDVTPKPLLPLGGKPLIEWQVEALVNAGVENIVINLHHLGEQIAEHLGDGGRFGAAIQYSREAELLETGGGIVNALPLLGSETFWLLNGDIYTDFNFATLPDELADGDLAHLVLTPTPAYRDAGDFECAGGRITGRGNAFVYCGIAVLSPALFDGQANGHFSLRDLYFEQLAAGRVSAQIHTGEWHDIGTLAQYEALKATFA